MDKRLISIKNMDGAMKSFVFLLYEMILESEPDLVLEIGVYYGQSTKAILLALQELKKGKLISIDRGNRTELLVDEFSDLKEYWNFIRGDSHQKEILEKANIIGKYDLLIIDGDHTYEGVKNDFLMYEPLVKPGGLILLHDVINRRAGIQKFWDEIKYEKVLFGWGHAKRRVIPGMGIVQKPGLNEPGYDWIKRNNLKNKL